MNNTGHRARLRERFLKSGLDGFLDYEIIELLLTLGTPRKDCKQTAKEAIKTFKGLNGVLDSTLEELQKIRGIGSSNAFGIKLFQAISERYTKEKIDPKNLLDSPKKIFEFLREKIGKEKKEHFVILYFDTKNNLIFDEISIGILNASLVHPREVFSKAILNNASHIVIAHNHPSGDPTPSNEDINTTKRLIEAGKLLGISVVDHIIVTRNNYSSCVELRLI
ncbi:MAG: DNA repair protein RadC [Candidatus Shapirobacteria bacterium]|nr:DNA repair protein RadC [Candidatus Shapirobacteria bacterium]MDD3003082.1 DNA repair protein RadC [Candidatus Shapirobacteria bacterium]MDD4382948.1 DNA repair protein RadC [Candidatus Shapirobacteria bacterium]